MKKVRRHLQGVLGNLCDAFASRYTDFEGYWLPGFLERDFEELQIDGFIRLELLPFRETPHYSPLVRAAEKIARERFLALLEGARIPPEYVLQASLSLCRWGHPRRGMVNGRVVLGHDIRLMAIASTDTAKMYDTGKTIFVAPHDPALEQRSSRS
jgi:hypothetical protein